jgi:hypothetical protein
MFRSKLLECVKRCPLTLPSPHRVGRGTILFSFLYFAGLMLGAVTAAEAEVWSCKKADGTEVFSDHSLGGHCREMQKLPALIPAPPPPRGEVSEGQKPDSDQVPIPGRGRRIDPPADSAIMISGITAVPNFSSLLGIANYQATMLLSNSDSDWTAEKVCIDVRFRDVGLVFLDVHQIGCTDSLKPLDDRPFTVTYTGMIPPRLFPIQAEAEVSFVKWMK